MDEMLHVFCAMWEGTHTPVHTGSVQKLVKLSLCLVSPCAIPVSLLGPHGSILLCVWRSRRVHVLPSLSPLSLSNDLGWQWISLMPRLDGMEEQNAWNSMLELLYSCTLSVSIHGRIGRWKRNWWGVHYRFHSCSWHPDATKVIPDVLKKHSLEHHCS